MIEALAAWGISKAVAYIGVSVTGGISVFICGWILKKIPTDKFAAWARKVGKAQGLAISTFFKAKLGKIWDSGVEPIVIDTLNALGIGWLTGFIEGLKSDN